MTASNAIAALGWPRCLRCLRDITYRVNRNSYMIPNLRSANPVSLSRHDCSETDDASERRALTNFQERLQALTGEKRNRLERARRTRMEARRKRAWLMQTEYERQRAELIASYATGKLGADRSATARLDAFQNGGRNGT